MGSYFDSSNGGSAGSFAAGRGAQACEHTLAIGYGQRVEQPQHPRDDSGVLVDCAGRVVRFDRGRQVLITFKAWPQRARPFASSAS